MKLSEKLWSDLKTDGERASWLRMGRGYETGVVAIAIQQELAMAYERLSGYRNAIVEEREACAKVCETLRDEDGYESWGTDCAAAIRARGEAEYKRGETEYTGGEI